MVHEDLGYGIFIPLNERTKGSSLALQGMSDQFWVAEVPHMSLTATVGHASPCRACALAGSDDRFRIIALCSCADIEPPPVNTQWPAATQYGTLGACRLISLATSML